MRPIATWLRHRMSRRSRLPRSSRRARVKGELQRAAARIQIGLGLLRCGSRALPLRTFWSHRCVRHRTFLRVARNLLGYKTRLSRKKSNVGWRWRSTKRRIAMRFHTGVGPGSRSRHTAAKLSFAPKHGPLRSPMAARHSRTVQVGERRPNEVVPKCVTHEECHSSKPRVQRLKCHSHARLHAAHRVGRLRTDPLGSSSMHHYTGGAARPPLSAVERRRHAGPCRDTRPRMSG